MIQHGSGRPWRLASSLFSTRRRRDAEKNKEQKSDWAPMEARTQPSVIDSFLLAFLGVGVPSGESLRQRFRGLSLWSAPSPAHAIIEENAAHSRRKSRTRRDYRRVETARRRACCKRAPAGTRRGSGRSRPGFRNLRSQQGQGWPRTWGSTRRRSPLAEDIATEELLALVERLNARPDVDGILVQLPLPAQVDSKRILMAVDPEKDVDGSHPCNVGKLVAALPGPRACTPAGIIELLKRSGIAISGKRAVVVGRSDIVESPPRCCCCTSTPP